MTSDADSGQKLKYVNQILACIWFELVLFLLPDVMGLQFSAYMAVCMSYFRETITSLRCWKGAGEDV